MSVAAAVMALAVLLAVTAQPANAGVPDPTNSTCDTCLVITPDGTFLYRLTLRDDANAPVSDATVFLDFTAATGISLCAASDPDEDRKVEGTTDALGVVDFYVRGGGQDLNLVTASSQLITFCLARPRTTDLTGNLIVDGADEAAHQALPPDSPKGDYDCDGDSDADDLAEIQNRTGRNCSSVQTEHRSWGSLKSIYR
jgi:hypothetical protein